MILIILEKMFGVINAVQLKAMLQLETYFNSVNKMLFSARLILLMKQSHIILTEKISS